MAGLLVARRGSLVRPRLAVAVTFKSAAQDLDPFGLWLPGEASGGTLTDESGNGWHGTLTGASPSASGGPGSGLANYAAFDGVDDHALLTKLGTFGSTGLPTSTWAMWLRTTTSAEGDYAVGTFNDDITTGVQLVGSNRDGSGNPSEGDTAFLFRGDGDQVIGHVGTDIYDGAWHFITYRLDGAAGQATVRIDKSDVTVVHDVENTLDVAANFQYELALGSRNNRGTVDLYFEADIAALAVWGTNQTDADLDGLYDATGV